MIGMRAIATVLLAALLVFGAAPYAAGEDFRYEPHGKRDPFVPLVGGSKVIVVKLEDITSAEDIKVEGIAMEAQGKKVAMINSEILKEGDKVGEVELVKIEKKFVTILIGGKSYKFYLPGEEEGVKSEK